MEAKSTGKRWTYAEFARLPSEGGARREVIAGDLVVTPAPGRAHQRAVTDLVTLLNAFAREHAAGEVFSGPFDVLFAEGDYLEPDIVFVRADRTHLLSDRGVEGAPDLVVEVVSPSTAGRDRGLKVERYRRYGVPAYWIVDPAERSVEVWRLAEGAARPEILGPGAALRWSPVAGTPAFEVRVGELLAG